MEELEQKEVELKAGFVNSIENTLAHMRNNEMGDSKGALSFEALSLKYNGEIDAYREKKRVRDGLPKDGSKPRPIPRPQT